MERAIEAMVGVETLRGVILDMGCGPGRFTEFFASRAKMVVCVDISRPFLESAQRLLTRNKVQDVVFFEDWVQSQKVRVLLRECDIFEHICDERFSYDLFFRAYTSLGYFPKAEELALLRHCSQRAQPKAKLVLDTFSSTFLRSRVGAEPRITVQDGLELREVYSIGSNGEEVDCEWRFCHAGGKDFCIRFQLGLYDRKGLSELLFAAGWKPERFYCDYLGNESALDSERLIAVASLA
jgi:SAM-dependent methyltransferase